jgi:hypothetical protein
MKTLNNFFEKTHLFKVWLVLYPILILFISGLACGLDYLSGESTFLTNFNYLKFSALMGMVYSWMVILMISMSRKSSAFWEYAKYFEELVDKVGTKEELERIWYNEYNELVTRCQGGAQIGEVKRLKAIIETKYKYIKE